MSHSNQTGRYPRTMAEAFGPYCDNHVEPMPEPKARRLQDAALYVIGLVVLVVIGVQA